MAWRKRPLSSVSLKALSIALLGAGFVQLAEADTYRYTNDRGQQVYADRVPPQFVKNGYEVLNDRGQVIQVVPRALTPAELAAQEATREQRQAEEAAARAQQQADNLLLRLYRSPNEIARKRDERLTLIDGQLTAMSASMDKLQAEVTNLQKTVDSYLASGGSAPEQTVQTLRIQQEELTRVINQRERLQSDRTTLISDSERDMARLSELMGLTEESAAD